MPQKVLLLKLKELLKNQQENKLQSQPKVLLPLVNLNNQLKLKLKVPQLLKLKVKPQLLKPKLNNLPNNNKNPLKPLKLKLKRSDI